MPHLVQMQQKLEKAGVVVFTVSLDNPEETPEAEAKVLNVLTKSGAKGTINLILAEKPELWQDKLDIGGPPLLVIFDRDNKLIKTFEFVDDFDKEVGGYVSEQAKK